MANLETLFPNADCPLSTRRPHFQWTAIARDVIYALKVIALREGQNADTAFKSARPVLSLKGLRSNSALYPRDAHGLAPNQVYAWRVSAFTSRGKAVAESNIELFYVEDDRLPISLHALTCCPDNRLSDDVKDWKTAYGSPKIQVRATGCLDSRGVIRLQGNQLQGDAVYQTLAGSNRLRANRRYAISFCTQALVKAPAYVRFRVLAFNGSLPENGNHPTPSAQIAVVGETGPVTDPNWTRYLMPVWRPGKDYEGIAITLITDEPPRTGTGAGQLSNICLYEVAEGDCGLFADGIVSDGEVDLDDAWSRYVEPGTKPVAVNVSFDRGSLTDLYGEPFDENGQSRWYRAEDPCVSVGGRVPDEAMDRAHEQENFHYPGNISPDDIADGAAQIVEKLGSGDDAKKWIKVPPASEKRCERFRPDKRRPFNGRDIIYIHGLRPDHIISLIAQSRPSLRQIYADTHDGAEPPQGASHVWPEDAAAFTGGSWDNSAQSFVGDGFFIRQARGYWGKHIRRHLGSESQPTNRYLIVGFNSSQRLLDNVNAVLWQIANAMNDGVGVVFDEKDPRGADCFGRDSIIVTHSTGALVADVALALAAQTAADATLRDELGDVSYIPRRARLHLSLHGAIAGSQLAALAVLGANGAAVAADASDLAIDVGVAVSDSGLLGIELLKLGLSLFGVSVDGIMNFLDEATDEMLLMAAAAVTTVNRSILVDLMPLAAKLLWGQQIDSTPVPVLTLASGYALSFQEVLLPGLDDSVVSTRSQSAGPSVLEPDTYAYIPPAARIFDMGIELTRSIPFFADQYRVIPGLAAFGSTPWLSPSGMVQPVLVPPTPVPRYRNHFTFLQSTASHNDPVQEPDEYSPTLNDANIEESLVVDQGSVFLDGLVDPVIATLMREIVRGQDLVITLRLPVPIFTLFPPSFRMGSITLQATIPLWRRQYHLLRPPAGSPFASLRTDCDYAYRFVLRSGI